MKRRQVQNVGKIHRIRILDALESAQAPMTALEVADTVTLSIGTCKQHLRNMVTLGTIHVVTPGRSGRSETYRAGKPPTMYVRDPILSALTLGAV